MLTTSVAGRTWHFSHAIGRPTAEHNGKTGGFMYPTGVAVAQGGVLFVLSRGFGFPTYADGTADMYRRIGKVTMDQEHIGDFARNEFTWPTGIAVAGDGNVYCADEHENKVMFFPPDRVFPFPEYDPDGERLGDWGESGSEPGQLDSPNGLAFDAEDNLYVVDSRNDRVQLFTKKGKYLLGWGGAGDGEGQFNRPWGVNLDKDGNVYVADWGNNRVQKFTADGSYVMSFGGSLGEGGDVDHPADVAVDSDGDVYVADWGNKRIQIYEPDGEIITALYGDAKKLSKAGEYVYGRDVAYAQSVNHNSDHPAIVSSSKFDRVTAVVVDEEDRLIATDSRGRLQVYAKDPDYEAGI